MNMTNTEKATRRVLAEFMRSQGYVTYAGLLLKFDLNFYRPKSGDVFIAAMVPGQYRILINPAVKDKEALSVFVRHEILHEYLKHFDRALKHLAERAELDYDKLDDYSIKELEKELNKTHDIFNIAGDYEISNRGYTEEDKTIIRNIGPLLDSTEEIRGLVTEDDHPDWVGLPIEDMYDLLMKEYEKDKKDAEKSLEKGDDSEDSSDSSTGSGENSGSSEQDDENITFGDGSGGESGEEDADIIMHNGHFIDEHTFVDETGKEYDLSNPN